MIEYMPENEGNKVFEERDGELQLVNPEKPEMKLLQSNATSKRSYSVPLHVKSSGESLKQPIDDLSSIEQESSDVKSPFMKNQNASESKSSYQTGRVDISPTLSDF